MNTTTTTYRQLLETLPVPLLLLRQDGTLDSCNKSAGSLLLDLEGRCLQPGEPAPDWLQSEQRQFLAGSDTQWSCDKRIDRPGSSAYLQITLARLPDSPTALTVATLHDLSRLHLMEDGLRELVEGVSEATGDAFFQFLVLHLARAVGADFAFIAEFEDRERTTIKTVAVCADGRLHPNFTFPLTGTPCELVVSQGPQSYTTGVLNQFPNDHLAIELGVDSYIGLPLINSKGRTLGPMAIFSRTPIREQHLAESMLQIFASRAAAELDRKHAEASLRETEARLKTIVNSVHTGILVIDPENHQIVDVNDVAMACLQRSRSELIGISCHQFICPNAEGSCPITDLNQELDNAEREIIRADGTRMPVIKTVSRVMLDGREHLLESFVDISQRKQHELALKESEERYRMLVENQTDLVVKTDLTGKLLFASPSFCQLFDRSEQELIGNPLLPVLIADEELLAEETSQLTCAASSCYREYRSATINGERWIGWALRRVAPPDSPYEAIIGMGRDITDRKTAEQTIEKMAYHDSLTGLPNRTLFYDRLQTAIQQAARDSRGAAVLFLDLDRFKAINDSLGHAGGDKLLQQVGRRLQQCVRGSDTVARLGGDEFVVLLTALENDHSAGTVVLKILETLSEPFTIGTQEVYNSASIGIALYPRDGRDPEQLLKNADMAMYQAKEAGRNTCFFFSPELNQRTTERILLESTMRKALERGEFFLAYQPQMELATGQVVGIEALIRWHHPDLGIVPPDRFIPIAEETGLIIQLGEWVLREACRQAREWLDRGHAPFRIGVNVSAKQFRQKNLASRIEEILKTSGLPAELLELELTESSVMESPDEAILTLRQLKQMGIQLSIDDFGTGYSSLSHLKLFPIDRLKIDRSFVKNITNDRNDATIAEAIIALAHSMKLAVVAEGVEYGDQLDFIALRSCDAMQGYYLSRPVPANEFEKFLKRLDDVGGTAHPLLGE